MKHETEIEGEPVGSPDDVEWLKSFTSWKLDLINCMSIDPRLQASDFRLAVILLRHLNDKTGQCNPSEETLAQQMKANPKTVYNCKKRLRDAGWLTWKRSQKSNFYTFHDTHVNAMLDYLTSMQDANRERRIRNALRNGKADTRNALRFESRNQLQIQTRNGLRTNTLREHLKGTPQDISSIEREVSTKRPYVAPNFDHLDQEKDASK